MQRSLIAALLLGMAACARQEEAAPAANPVSNMSRTLQPAGDPVAGRQAFQELRCWSCHEIYGGDMPKPVARPPVPVYLGGNAIQAPDDLYILQAIIEPSHQLAPGWGTEGVQSGTRSRMGDYSRVMTVRQLIDVIAFVKSRYGRKAEAAAPGQQQTPASP